KVRARGPAALQSYLDAQGTMNGYTKLIDAALRGNADVMTVLLDAGADTSLAGFNGRTALDAALTFNEQQGHSAAQGRPARPFVSHALLARLGAAPSASPAQIVADAKPFVRQQAYSMMDRLIDAKDPVTGLLPLHVRTENGKLVAADHIAAGLDMGRATSG